MSCAFIEKCLEKGNIPRASTEGGYHPFCGDCVDCVPLRKAALQGRERCRPKAKKQLGRFDFCLLLLLLGPRSQFPPPIMHRGRRCRRDAAVPGRTWRGPSAASAGASRLTFTLISIVAARLRSLARSPGCLSAARPPTSEAELASQRASRDVFRPPVTSLPASPPFQSANSQAGGACYVSFPPLSRCTMGDAVFFFPPSLESP